MKGYTRRGDGLGHRAEYAPRTANMKRGQGRSAGAGRSSCSLRGNQARVLPLRIHGFRRLVEMSVRCCRSLGGHPATRGSLGDLELGFWLAAQRVESALAALPTTNSRRVGLVSRGLLICIHPFWCKLPRDHVSRGVIWIVAARARRPIIGARYGLFAYFPR